MKLFLPIGILMLTCIVSCSGPDYTHVELYNASADAVTATVNDQTYKVNPKEVAYVSSKSKEQFFEYGVEKQLIKTQEQERFLVNLLKDSIVRLELLYDNKLAKGVDLVQEGSIPYKVIKLRDKKYYLPAELITNQLVFKDYDYTIGEMAPKSSEIGEIEFNKNNYRKQWKGYFKLYSIEELMESYKAINREPTFVQQIMNASIKVLNPDFTIRLQNGIASVNRKGKSIGQLGNARVSNDDVIEFDKADVYDPAAHGSIAEVIAKIPRCNFTTGKKIVHKEVTVDVVLVEKSTSPKVVIR